jgi:hypothetical protein
MNGLGFTAQIQILLTVSALLASLCFLCLLPLAILSLNPLLNRHTAVLIKLGGVLPTMVGAALILIVVDNFTYTVFRWGVVSTQGWSRGLYGIGFILVIVLCYLFVINTLVRSKEVFQ